MPKSKEIKIKGHLFPEGQSPSLAKKNMNKKEIILIFTSNKKKVMFI